MRFSELIEIYGNRMKGKTAFLDYEFGEFRQISCEEFLSDVRRSAAFFSRTKGEKRRRIGIVAENSYRYLVQLFGILLSGEIAVPLNQNMAAETLLSFVRELGIGMLLADEDWAEELLEWKNKAASAGKENGSGSPSENVGAFPTGLAVMELSEGWEEGELPSWEDIIKGQTAREAAGEDTALMLLSSGTSGRSKAVMLSAENLTASSAAILRESEKEPKEVLQALPMYHIGGIILTIEEMMRGNTVAISSAKYFMLQVMEHRFSKLILVPAMAEMLLNKAEEKEEISEGLSEVEEMLCVGAPLLKKDADRMKERGIAPRVYYGMTETTGTVSCFGDYRDGACGIVAGHNEVRLQNGEILIRGANVMKGYYGNEEETAKVLKDGWLHTGDLGEIDEDGYLFIRGRLKNIIILSNGENVSPEELEEKLLPCPEVTEVLVFAGEKGITAKVYSEGEAASAEEREKAVRDYVRSVNRTLPTTHKIKETVFSPVPMEKSGIGKLKRSL